MDLRSLFSILFIVFLTNISAQDTAVKCINPKFEKEVDSYLSYDIPIITVADAQDSKKDYIFLDAREKNEFLVSHIEDAINVGYDDFNVNTISEIDKDTPLIIYCSIGYRSEKIGTKLKEAGYTNVQNLYGSIFEWVNQHYPVYNSDGLETSRIHTYNKSWSKWISSDDVKKIW